MRNINIAQGEYYHIFNRGMNKQSIFIDRFDYARFLFTILYFQSPIIFQNLGRFVRVFVKHSVFNILQKQVDEVVENRYVEVVAFCLMPNHFHLILKEEEEGGIAKYMQRALNSYTKYFNTRYKKSGHLFQGPYKAVHVENNTQLLHLSAYIHKNPIELPKWKGKEFDYPWSSLRDFTDKNRFGDLLARQIIIDQFNNIGKYKKFIKTSTAKEPFLGWIVKHSVFNISDFPLAVASGIDSENVLHYTKPETFVDCFLVNTGISKSFTELDPVKVAKLAEVLQKIN